ncbi:hypothetical protein KUTeg_010587 [Tegillarca granosa]|uniref:Aldehyde oxidase/xanthine dehydrogenase a/b hammerhead domain-containing protein n=1 Tax=Tegillarca granosa TaxID=220873 RepID=A0ABQ9F6M4_TEGGR|nr:hypothetical protein KUTeg_010587 [Tegillarca granosa]
MIYRPSSGSQVFHVPHTEEHVAVWKPLPHYAGESLVTGEAVFIDDMPRYQNELFLAFVTSTKAHANIVSIDTSEAMKVPGVVDYIDRKDVPSANTFGLVTKDHLLFAEGKVLHYGQIIGAIAADTRETARKAADLVKVVYEELDTVFTIKEAIEKKSFFEFSSEIKKGDVEASVKLAEVVLSGELEIGTQEHFYMEPQTCLVIPKQERNEVEIFASCQGTNGIQAEVARILGIPSNRIVAKCKRAGGAFGGKSIDSVYGAGAAAVMATKTGRPVRCVVDRVTDFRFTGKRHPVFASYKVGCNKTGKITSVDINFYVNAGHCLDTSEFVILKGLPQISGCYNFDNFRAKGQVCRTNTPSTTPVRGFGAPKMVFIIENIINDVAINLKIDKTKVCQFNMYREGNETPSKMVLKNFNLPRCLKECLDDSSYEKRKQYVEIFNIENRWKKRGISVVPIMYPIGFPPPALNQAIALVHAYLDGSVLLAHGGIDMGQGMNTKMIQIAATELGIPIDNIFISETSTNTTPNATNTSASTGTDIYAGAVKNACEILAERLKPYKTANPDGPFKKWIEAAFADRVSLSVSGFFKMKDKPYDFATHTGDICLYYTFGAGCSEVEIDCLTGEHQILRTDIVMDLGKSLNPAVDIGQIEGAFTMACGLYTTEEIHLDKNGRISESGPVNYKIPTVRNIPREFKVKVLKDTENDLAVYSAKGTGEPPLLLAITVHHAIKEAILAARKDSGITGNFQLNSPATVERIRMACKDKITDKCEKTIGKDLQSKILLY